MTNNIIYNPMKKQLIFIVSLLFSSGLLAQGIYNNGAKIVVGSGSHLVINGAGGNYRNETNVTDGSILLQGTLHLQGNYTNNVTAADILGAPGLSSEVVFNGAALQSIGGTTTAVFNFAKLSVNNPLGVSLLKDALVSNALTLTTGLLTLGSSNLSLGPAAVVAGTPSASAMVVATGTGELRKQFSATGSFTYPVGDNTGTAEYSPVTLNFTTGTFGAGAYSGVNLVNAAYPDPYITTSYINRYWNLSQSGITGFTCDAAFNYNVADIVGVESDLYCVRMLPLPITPFNATNVVLHQLTATGLTSLSTFTGALGIKHLNLTLYLEGLYAGAGTMNPAMKFDGVNIVPQWGLTIADHLTIELHDALNYLNILYSAADVPLNTNGTATVNVPGTFGGNYYLTVKHRNSIETVSAAPVSFATANVNYGFNTAATQAFGNNLKLLSPGVYGIYGGDANSDGAVDGLDMIAVDNDAILFSMGYLLPDLNGDGSVDGLDMILCDNNTIGFVSKITP